MSAVLTQAVMVDPSAHHMRTFSGMWGRYSAHEHDQRCVCEHEPVSMIDDKTTRCLTLHGLRSLRGHVVVLVLVLRNCVVLVLVLVLHSCAVTVSSTGARNQFQGDDKPRRASLPGFPCSSLSGTLVSYGASAVTRTSDRGHLTDAEPMSSK